MRVLVGGRKNIGNGYAIGAYAPVKPIWALGGILVWAFYHLVRGIGEYVVALNKRHAKVEDDPKAKLMKAFEMFKDHGYDNEKAAAMALALN